MISELGFVLLLILLALLVIGLSLAYLRQARELQKQAKQLQQLKQEALHYRSQAQDAEMQERDLQLNPHLFKNTLNAIQSYAYKTHLSLERLGGVLDYLLYDSRVNFTSLEEELEFLTSFVELNRFRLNPLFEFSFSVSADQKNPFYRQKLILPLITVDFIENAFRHGDLSSAQGFISVTLRLEGSQLVYMVSNRLNPEPLITHTKGGLGQHSLQRRLELKYTGCYELVYTPGDDVYKAYLKLDLDAVKHKMHPAG